MATFWLSPAVPEQKYIDVAAQEDNALHICAFSPRRTPWQLACAFLDAGYSRHKYHMYGLHSTSGGGMLMVKFVNFRDAHLLYGQAFHYGCEMVVFTGANIFTNYSDQFPNNGNFIHRVVPEQPMAQDVPPAYPKVPPGQEPAVALELSLLSVSNELPLAEVLGGAVPALVQQRVLYM